MNFCFQPALCSFASFISVRFRLHLEPPQEPSLAANNVQTTAVCKRPPWNIAGVRCCLREPGEGERAWNGRKLAPEAGLEPATFRLTAGRSTIELLWNPDERVIY